MGGNFMSPAPLLLLLLLVQADDRRTGYKGLPWGSDKDAFSRHFEVTPLEEATDGGDLGTNGWSGLGYCLWYIVGLRPGETVHLIPEVSLHTFRKASVTEPKYPMDGYWGSAYFWNGGFVLMTAEIEPDSLGGALRTFGTSLGPAKTTVYRNRSTGLVRLDRHCHVFAAGRTVVVVEYLERARNNRNYPDLAGVFQLDKKFLEAAQRDFKSAREKSKNTLDDAAKSAIQRDLNKL